MHAGNLPIIALEYVILSAITGETNLVPQPVMLTHLPQDKMATISRTGFSNAFQWMKSFVLWLKFHSSLFLIDSNPGLV